MITTEKQARDTEAEQGACDARAKRTNTVVWLVGITAVLALCVLQEGATVGTGLGVIGVSAMVAFISYLILKEEGAR